MTPKDKGILRELLHEYGPSVVIQAIAKQGYWADGGQVFLLKQAEELGETTNSPGNSITVRLVND